MTFESVIVSALLLANLTVPSKPLEALGLHRICEVFPDKQKSRRRVKRLPVAIRCIQGKHTVFRLPHEAW